MINVKCQNATENSIEILNTNIQYHLNNLLTLNDSESKITLPAYTPVIDGIDLLQTTLDEHKSLLNFKYKFIQHNEWNDRCPKFYKLKTLFDNDNIELSKIKIINELNSVYGDKNIDIVKFTFILCFPCSEIKDDSKMLIEMTIRCIEWSE